MNKLKLPLWSDIVYLCLTVLAPIVFLLIEAYRVPSDGFRVTFTVCTTALLAYILIRKFILTKYIEKLSNQCATIELNYQTGVGDPEKNKTLWVKNKIVEYTFNISYIILLGSLLLLIIWGVQTLGMKLKGTMLFVFLLYIVAFSFRIIMYISTFIKKKDTNEEPSEEGK